MTSRWWTLNVFILVTIVVITVQFGLTWVEDLNEPEHPKLLHRDLQSLFQEEEEEVPRKKEDEEQSNFLLLVGDEEHDDVNRMSNDSYNTGIDGDPHSTPVTSTRRNTTCATCERISHIENWCKGRPTPNKLTSVTWRNLYLDHHHKLLFCEVPKAGASTMKRILIRASPLHSTQDSDPEWDAHKDLKKFNITHPTPYFNDLKKYLNGSYFKFILVRHPMSRLLSAYKDKFYDSVFLPKTSQYILRNYRNKSSGWDGFNPNKDYVRSNPVTWQEFTDFVAAEYPNGSDRHWKTVQELCSPCLIHYDAILKLETIEDDMEVISKHLGGNRVQIPTENMSKGMKGKTFRSFFEELSSDVINGLKKVYADDMTAFGYTFDDNLLPKYVNSSSQC